MCYGFILKYFQINIQYSSIPSNNENLPKINKIKNQRL